MKQNQLPDPANFAHRLMAQIDGWEIGRHTAQFGTSRDALFATLNEAHGPGNWWFGWQMPNGEVWDFLQVFWNVYVEGYTRYFDAHPDEAEYLAVNYSYAYDLTEIPRQLAYAPAALVNLPGLPNQFHHVALNYAIAARSGGWRGSTPIAVRGPGTPGERWNPGHIPAPSEYVNYDGSWLSGWTNVWWDPESIEGVYQFRRILVTRSQPLGGEQ